MISFLLGLGLAATNPVQVFDEPVIHQASCLFSGPPAVADFDGDGNRDLAIVNSFLPVVDGSFVLYLGDGMGGFRKGERTPVLGDGVTISLATCITAGDVDGDGNLDAILGDNQGLLWIFPGRGDGRFSLPIKAGGGFPRQSYLDAAQWQHLSACDLNGDGRAEVVGQFTIIGFATGVSHQPLTIYRHGGSWILDAWHSARPGRVRALEYADIDGDGSMDMVVTADNATFNTSGQSDLFILTTGGGFLGYFGPYIVGGNPVSIAAGDLDGDGVLELVLGGENGSCNLHRLANPRSFALVGQILPPDPTRVVNFVGCGDLDGDGGSDLVLASTDCNATSRVQVFTGDGAGTFQAGQAITVPGTYVEAGSRMPCMGHLGDMTHDGNPDLVFMVTKDSSTRFAMLRNCRPFRRGYNHLAFGLETPGLSVAPTDPGIHPANPRFGLRVVGNQGRPGFLLWNLVLWNNTPMRLMGGVGIVVPPRVIIPMSHRVSLPIPADGRLTSGGLQPVHYFQWVSAEGNAVSSVLEVRF